MSTIKNIPVEEDELEDQDETLSEEDEDNESEYEEEGPVIIGLSTGEKLIADIIDEDLSSGCVTVYRPLRLIEIIDGDQTQLRFATYNPFLYDQILPIRIDHVVFISAITDDAEELYVDYCMEMEKEERKQARKQQKEKKEQNAKTKSNVITAPFRKIPEKP